MCDIITMRKILFVLLLSSSLYAETTEKEALQIHSGTDLRVGYSTYLFGLGARFYIEENDLSCGISFGPTFGSGFYGSILAEYNVGFLKIYSEIFTSQFVLMYNPGIGVDFSRICEWPIKLYGVYGINLVEYFDPDFSINERYEITNGFSAILTIVIY
jgi:hypothetical protein